MVLVSDHIIIIHHLDVMLHIYNTLEEIQVALAANWESTSVMVKIDPPTPLVGLKELQLSPNSHKISCEVCWVINGS